MRQIDIHVLLMMLEHDPEQYRLSDEQLRQLDQAIADTDAGKFVSDDEIERALYRSWAQEFVGRCGRVTGRAVE